jgi:hypothetical protein
MPEQVKVVGLDLAWPPLQRKITAVFLGAPYADIVLYLIETLYLRHTTVFVTSSTLPPSY